MSLPSFENVELSRAELEFLIEAGEIQVEDKDGMARRLREDPEFRGQVVGSEGVFRKVLYDQQVLLTISPLLFFEILLRKAARDLAEISYTVERAGSMNLPVFDSPRVVQFVAEEPVVAYLADMLSSFTRVQSFSFTYRVRRGLWRKLRFRDLDVHDLMKFAEGVGGEHRLAVYKRIADTCLFILGIFPDHAESQYRYPLSGNVRPQVGGRPRISPADYEKHGRRFYKLAAEHRAARGLGLADIFARLHEEFQRARKPLTFIAEHYLEYRRAQMFA